jgi:phosphopantetheine--protein transferase-like protein
MFIISNPDYVRCSFGSGDETSSDPDKGRVDVFFAETKDLSPRYIDIKKFISPDEQFRADKFHFDKNRETYITCHAILRSVLAKSMNISPLEVTYGYGLNNKPSIPGNPLYFNITHTKEAFAFAVSNDFNVGIDLERINQNTDILPVMESFFSKKEREYILMPKTDPEIRNRFFQLWTRKEALLKAFGTGIIDNLAQVEVSENGNLLNRKLFDKLNFDTEITTHFLYSKKIGNSYLSIAIPDKALICFNHLNIENINSYLD